MIKPDAVKRNLIGKVLARYESEGLTITHLVKKHLTLKEAEGFYEEHRGRGFFAELVAFMSSAPVVMMVMRGENAVARVRELMGATDPLEAAAGTIRKEIGLNKGENSVHGSDSLTSAAREIKYFFPETSR
jgi:nucleoside-diphosphate kinase